MSECIYRPSYYALLYSTLKDVAYRCGWAIAIHGSLNNDMDLVAIAWNDDASTTMEMLQETEAALSGTVFSYKWNGPHHNNANRTTWTLPLESDLYVDLTVVDFRGWKELGDE